MSNSELIQDRQALIGRARAIIDRSKAENRDITREEEQKYDRIMHQVDRLKTRIDASAQYRARREQAFRESPSRGVQLASYRDWLRCGKVGEALIGSQVRFEETRDTVASTDSKGGYLALPLEISADIAKALDDRVWVRQLATVTPVRAAKKLGVRKLITRMADSDWTTEVAAVTEDTTQAFDRRDLEPQLVSKLAKASMRALAISSRPEEEINEELTYKFAVTEERAFLNGDGSGKPLGVFVASAAGISTGQDVTASSATAFTGDDLIDLKFTLREAYLNDPSLAWVVSREFVKRARKLKVASTTGGDDLEYLWQPGLTEGAPDKILDIPYYMSEFAPNTFTTGLYVAVLGAWKHYRIAEMEAMLVQRLTERYAATNEVGFIGRRWVDGAPILEEAFVRLKLA